MSGEMFGKLRNIIINTFMKRHSYKKILGIVLWLIILVHFLKDITQDILGISTVLDSLGNIEEDITSFPTWLEYLYHWAMVNTVIGELTLIFLIPKYIFKSIGNTEKLLIYGIIIYIPVMFTVTFLLSQ